MSRKVGLAFAGVRKDYLETIAHETIANLGMSMKMGLVDRFLFTDAGSPEPYAHRLEEQVKFFGGTYKREDFAGVGFHQRNLFIYANDLAADEVYYLEGDSKPGLVHPDNMKVWQSVYRNDSTIDINIPCRSEKTLLTVPVEQRVSEMNGLNVPFFIILRRYGYKGKVLDFGWGPKAANRRALPYFTELYTKHIDGKLVPVTDWGHTYVAMVHAADAGLKFGGIEIDTIHPPSRKQHEEGNLAAERERYRRRIEEETTVAFEHFFHLNGLKVEEVALNEKVTK